MRFVPGILAGSICVASAVPAVTGFDELFRQGLLALQRGELSQAAASLEGAARLRPDNGRVQVALAQTYRRSNEAAKANRAAAEAARLGKSDPVVLQSLETYYFEAAQKLLGEEKFATAVSILDAAEKHIGVKAQLELTLGVACYGLRRFDDAAEAFLRTISLAPAEKQAYLFLGKMLDQVPNRLPEALDRFIQFEKANPADPDGYVLHAKALQTAGIEPETAKLLLEKAIALDANHAAAHFELGSLLYQTNRFAEAASELERAAMLAPSDPVIHYRLSRVYERLQRPDAAAAERKLHRKLIEQQKFK